MLYFLLICFIFILAFSLFSIIRTIRNINKQIKQQRKIRVSLSNRDIEELAYAINQKDKAKIKPFIFFTTIQHKIIFLSDNKSFCNISAEASVTTYTFPDFTLLKKL